MSTTLSSSAGREMEVRGGRRKRKEAEESISQVSAGRGRKGGESPEEDCFFLTWRRGDREGTHEKTTVGRFSKTLGQK